jgi:HNH endonuclease
MPPLMADQRVGAALRRVVRARARDLCEYCRCPGQFATQSFTVEHVEPRDQGGETVLENLAWACFGCNSHKHTATQGVDPETGERVALFHPRRQRCAPSRGVQEREKPCKRRAFRVARAGFEPATFGL